MKTFFTLLLSLTFSLIFAQDKMFVHTAAVENIIADATYIDHPLLNGNPDAKLIISHVWNPGGTSFDYHNHTTGVYFDTMTSKWVIYNEDVTTMTPNVSFNVYVVGGDYGFKHTAGEEEFSTTLTHNYLDGNPDAIATLTHDFGQGSRLNANLGFYYSGTNWKIYNEDNVTDLPLNALFHVAIAGEPGVVSVKHTVTAANIHPQYDDSSVLDHSLLNGNPDAVFVITHNYGSIGSLIDVNEIPAVWYNNDKWNVSTEDEITMPIGATFNMMIFDSTMATEEVTSTSMSKAYPNPVVNQVNFESKEQIKSITIYNLLGQEVFKSNGNSSKMTVDLSSQPAGTYVAKIKTDKSTETIKLIKK